MRRFYIQLNDFVVSTYKYPKISYLLLGEGDYPHLANTLMWRKMFDQIETIFFISGNRKYYVKNIFNDRIWEKMDPMEVTFLTLSCPEIK